MITLTAKIQILPDKQEYDLLLRSMKAYMDACNFISEHIFRTHDLGQASLHRSLYDDIRGKFGLPSQMACSTMRTVIASYRTMLTNQYDWVAPEYKHLMCDLCWNKDYSLKAEHFSVNTLEGRIKVGFCKKGMQKYFDGSWKFGTATLVYRRKKFYLHIPVSKEIPELQDADVNNVVGVDLGVNFIATAYDSRGRTTFYSGKQIKHKRAQFKRTRQELQKRQTASARQKLKKIGQRENRWMQDVNHRITKALVEAYPAGTLFVLEDLTGIRGATEKVRLRDRYIMTSWAFYDFRQKLEYKAKLYGHKVLVVDPRYTSQMCPKCGHIEKANRNKKTHTFCCKSCGYSSNDDRIGAMNLHMKGLTRNAVINE